MALVYDNKMDSEPVDLQGRYLANTQATLLQNNNYNLDTDWLSFQFTVSGWAFLLEPL